MTRTKRLSRSKRGYGRDWQAVRLAYLTEHPLCALCQQAGVIKEAEVVDHIKSIAEAPELRLDTSNLRSLCIPCHNRRTFFEQGLGLGKRWSGCDEHGVPTDPKHVWRKETS